MTPAQHMDRSIALASWVDRIRKVEVIVEIAVILLGFALARDDEPERYLAPLWAALAAASVLLALRWAVRARGRWHLRKSATNTVQGWS